jgi:HEAT repeat protein
MKRVLALLAIATVAQATSSSVLPQQVQNALTTIDSVPTQLQLDSVFAGQALTGLVTIANDTNADVGIRLRAIHALVHYCAACVPTDTAHVALVTLINLHANDHVGSGLLLLRAAIESSGPLRVQSDLSTLVPLLDHPSRDIRATTARALRDLCNSQAIGPLRARYQHETSDQVRLSISEALRVLGQSPSCM